MHEFFRKLATNASNAAGSPWVFFLAVTVVAVWALSGPVFRFSDTWQLVINTGTTIVTFLMVFLIQNTQNRDSKAIHIKLDELIRSIKGARDNVMDVEELSDQELGNLHEEYKKIHEKYERELTRRRSKKV